MKRIVASSFLVVLLLLFACTGSWAEADPPISSAPEDSLVFVGGSHAGTGQYRSHLLMQTAKQGNLTFSVELSVYRPERAADWMARVSEDMQIVSGALSVVDKPLTVYVVKNLRNGMVQRAGNAVYCTVDDILNGTYRAALIEAMSEIPAYWKAVGLSGVLFEQPVDGAMLRGYYEQADDLDILSLFPAYFHKEFASDTEMLIARDTAFLLADYIIREHGMGIFLSEDRLSDRQDWLQSLGVNRDYNDQCADTLAGYRYEFWRDQYPLVVTTDRGDRIHMRFIEDDLDSPALVRMFLYEANVGVQAMLDGVAKEAPEYLQAVLYNCRKPVNVYFDPTALNSHASLTGTQIVLTSSYAYLHEVGHIFTIPSSVGGLPYAQEKWKYEGIAEYLSVSFYQTSHKKKNVYGYLEPAYSHDGDSDQPLDIWDAFEARVIKKYRQTHGDFPHSWKDFNVASYWKVKAYMQTQDILANPGIELGWILTIGKDTNWLGKMSGGYELTYRQMYSFTDYLIETHGLSAFLKYCIDNTTFEEAFGLPYEDAKAMWIMYTETNMN